MLFVAVLISVLVVTWVAIPVCVIERKGFFVSLVRNFTLLRGQFLQTLAIVVCYWLLHGLVNSGLAQFTAEETLGTPLRLGAALVVATLMGPLRAMLVAMSYVEARTIHEDARAQALASVFGDSPNAIVPDTSGETAGP